MNSLILGTGKVVQGYRQHLGFSGQGKAAPVWPAAIAEDLLDCSSDYAIPFLETLVCVLSHVINADCRMGKGPDLG